MRYQDEISNESVYRNEAEYKRTWYHPTVPLAQGFVPAIALKRGSEVHCLPLT
jgi:hypothetical protein